MLELASQIDVPTEHAQHGWVIPSVEENLDRRILHVRSSTSSPKEASSR